MTTTRTRMLLGVAGTPLFYPEDGGLAPEPDIPWLPEDDQHFDEIPE